MTSKEIVAAKKRGYLCQVGGFDRRQGRRYRIKDVTIEPSCQALKESVGSGDTGRENIAQLFAPSQGQHVL
ncbi:MAG: hypothetical protein LC700_02690 [Actinobacteria bacterium]|nr:hypothetical protein [Actinomycetota bacterium]